MVEAVKSLQEIKEIAQNVSVPIMVNQIHGGKSPNWSLNELEDSGVSIVIYSSPCLFSAQFSMEIYLKKLKENKKLPDENTVLLEDFNEMIYSKFKV